MIKDIKNEFNVVLESMNSLDKIKLNYKFKNAPLYFIFSLFCLIYLIITNNENDIIYYSFLSIFIFSFVLTFFCINSYLIFRNRYKKLILENKNIKQSYKLLIKYDMQFSNIKGINRTSFNVFYTELNLLKRKLENYIIVYYKNN